MKKIKAIRHIIITLILAGWLASSDTPQIQWLAIIPAAIAIVAAVFTFKKWKSLANS